LFKKLYNFNVVKMADVFATDVCKSALISFSTTFLAGQEIFQTEV
jgi:hypothetical protein